jgi:hypothetical protein
VRLVPGRDVHLILQPAATPLQLQIFEFTATGFRDIASDASTQYLRFDNTIIGVAAGLVTPRKVGDTFIEIRLMDGGGTYEGVMRVTVHQALEKFWIANNRATVREASSNYVLSVYAQFNDGAAHPVGDVSLHPYLGFQSLDTTAFTVDAQGRLTGVAAGKEADAQVKIGALPAARVRVHVREKVDTPRPILNLRSGTGLLERGRNLLFVAEGYTAARESAFDEQVTRIINTLFLTKAQSPFAYLDGRFNIWSAFEPSPEPGVTIGPPVLEDGALFPAELPEFATPREVEVAGQYSVDTIVRVGGIPGPLSPSTLAQAKTAWAGMPTFAGKTFDSTRLTQAGFDRWKQQRIDRILRPKDTVFGFIRGRRMSDPEPSDPAEPGGWFSPPGSFVVIFPDRRRSNGAAGNFEDETTAYLQTLRFGSDPSATNFDPSPYWSETGRDKGLVFFLVDDDVLGGVAGSNFGAIGSRPQSRVVAVTGTFPDLDHDPTLSPPEFDEAFTTAVFAHELGHILGLHEEYEGGYVGSGKPESQPEIDWIERHPNATHVSAVATSAGATTIAIDRVKWNWERVARSSTVADVKAPLATGTIAKQVQVTVEVDQGGLWNGLEAGARVFLRAPDLNRLKFKMSPPLRLTALSGDVLTLEADGADAVTFGDFPPGSAVFLPKKDKAGQLQRLIPGPVAARLAQGVFSSRAPGLCGAPDLQEEYPPDDIAAFSYPRNRWSVIAAYEGGANCNCDIYRPTGFCKMRRGYRWEIDNRVVDEHMHGIRDVPFCFVCKYFMVHLLNPAMLWVLDLEYPEDC